MAEEAGERCGQCGAALLQSRSYCVQCHARIPGRARQADGRRAEILRQLPSTREPDDSIVLVPEARDARLRRERRNRRLAVAAVIACVLLTGTALTVRHLQAQRRARAAVERREAMARRELDLYAAALELFRADFGRYPSVAEGLGSLYRRPSTLPAWRGPYIEGDFSVDPWGNEYVYRVFDDGAGFDLFTFGPEGEAAKRAFHRVCAGPGCRAETSAP